jgi:hypothetical protein
LSETTTAGRARGALDEALYDNHGAISMGNLNVFEALCAHAVGARVSSRARPSQCRPAHRRGRPRAYAVAHSVGVRRPLPWHDRVHTYLGYLFHHENPRRARELSGFVARAPRRIASGDADGFEICDPAVVRTWTFASGTLS